jgi:hypothetical protein
LPQKKRHYMPRRSNSKPLPTADDVLAILAGRDEGATAAFICGALSDYASRVRPILAELVSTGTLFRRSTRYVLAKYRKTYVGSNLRHGGIRATKTVEI